jgi:hypothetical protein
MSTFWGSLFGGANSTLNSGIGQLGQQSGFATSLGEQNLSQASNFTSALLSGNQSKIGQLLAPQFAAIQGQKQQALNTTAQFGNRSGGNNAANQNAGDQARTQQNQLVAGLTSSALGTSANLGSSLFSQGAAIKGQQIDASQQQMENWSNSILGLGVTKAAGYAEGLALGA